VGAALAAGIGAAVGGSAGAATAFNEDVNNRQLHLTEAQKLAKLKEGKSEDERHRLDAAACALVLCANGVPPSDPNYNALQALQKEGQAYGAEQAQLLQTGEFVYQPYLDAARDWITQNGEAAQRLGGAIDLTAGGVGTVAGGGIAAAGVIGCAPSAGTSCLAVPLGVYLAYVSNEQAQEGNQALFGPYQSTEGQRVLDSFDPATYPGERDPLKEIGMDLSKLGLTIVAGKLVPKALAKAEGLEVKGGTGQGATGQSGTTTNNSIKLVEQDGNVYQFNISGSNGNFSVVTEMTKDGNQLILNGMHIDGPGAGSSSLGELRNIARTLGQQYGVDQVVINGGVRTSGANPGKTPRSIVIKVNQ
jgi:filamentous hemagglutinin